MATKMLKKDLEIAYNRALERIEDLELENDRLSEAYCEMENQYADAVNEKDTMFSDGIRNLENFVYFLRNQNLYTEEMERAIDTYMEVFND